MTTTVTGLLLAGLAPAGMAASLAAREPDQGMPARPLCGSHLGRHHAGQSAAPMVLLDGLRPDVRPAPHRRDPRGTNQLAHGEPKKTNHSAPLDATDLHGSSTPAIKRGLSLAQSISRMRNPR